MMEDLYRRNGGTPGPLPDTAFDENNMAWSDLKNNAKGRTLCGYELAPPKPTHDASTHYVTWDLDHWEVLEHPPAPWMPIRVTKMDFSRLFTLDERVAMEKLRRAIAAADLNEPGNYLLGILATMFENFNLPAEFIEINHPQVIYAVDTLLVGAGVLTSERAVQVLAVVYP